MKYTVETLEVNEECFPSFEVEADSIDEAYSQAMIVLIDPYEAITFIGWGVRLGGKE